MTTLVKICGLKTPDAIEAARDADYLGFMFFPPSPRNITPEDAAKLKPLVTGQKTVAVTVDPDDGLLHEIMEQFNPDYIQLHGSETEERVTEIKDKFERPVIKAFKIIEPHDFIQVAGFEDIADLLLFDAKSPDGLHGGSGVSFDWNMLAGRKFSKPYFLSGGLNAHNVQEALRLSGATMVDISSGVESSRGVKSPAMIAEFIAKAKRTVTS